MFGEMCAALQPLLRRLEASLPAAFAHWKKTFPPLLAYSAFVNRVRICSSPSRLEGSGSFHIRKDGWKRGEGLMGAYWEAYSSSAAKWGNCIVHDRDAPSYVCLLGSCFEPGGEKLVLKSNAFR